MMRYGDVAETSAAGSGSRECQTTADALCLLYILYASKNKYTVSSHIIPYHLAQPRALDYEQSISHSFNPIHNFW